MKTNQNEHAIKQITASIEYAKKHNQNPEYIRQLSKKREQMYIKNNARRA